MAINELLSMFFETIRFHLKGRWNLYSRKGENIENEHGQNWDRERKYDGEGQVQPVLLFLEPAGQVMFLTEMM